MAEQTIEMLEEVDADWIVTNSTSCYAAMAQDYQALFADSPEWHDRAAKQAARLIDVTTFLDQVAKFEAARVGARGPRSPITTPASHTTRSASATRRAGSSPTCSGSRLTEMHDSSVCCGFGGSFSTDYPAVSAIIAGRKLDNATGTTADVIVADNPGCIMQLRGALHARKSPVRVLHLVELIDERMRERMPGK